MTKESENHAYWCKSNRYIGSDCDCMTATSEPAQTFYISEEHVKKNENSLHVADDKPPLPVHNENSNEQGGQSASDLAKVLLEETNKGFYPYLKFYELIRANNAAIRNEALEEAAKYLANDGLHDRAKHIRSLKKEV